MQIKQPVILFDGFCNLCNGTVNFLIRKDIKKQFVFIPLQSESGKLLIQKFQIPDYTDSVILIKEDKLYIESDCVPEIADMLNYPWKLGVISKYIPKKLRDAIYRLIAKNRYRLFGKTKKCRIPGNNGKDIFEL
jgi:predicted DCC family thiol-disulfide oxidoreductase YuxK